MLGEIFATETVLAALAGGGLLTAAVTVYKARADRDATDASTLATEASVEATEASVRATDASVTSEEAQAGKTLVDTALTLIIPLSDRVVSLESEHRECKAQLDDLTARLANLEKL